MMRRATGGAATAALIATALITVPPAATASPTGDSVATPTGPTRTDSYIVTTAGSQDPTSVVDDVAPRAETDAVAGPAYTGAVADLRPEQADALDELPGVVVEREQTFTAAGPGRRARAAGDAATWGLDRVDQRQLPLDGRFEPTSAGQGVHVYVVDSGLIPDHPEFTGRIGKGAYTSGNSVRDCYGHGTHVAGIIASSRFGMAPAVKLHPVKVLGCDGGGSTSAILSGLNWVARNAPRKAIVNLSLRGNYSPALNRAVRSLTASGRLVVTASGNDGNDACRFSPASEPSVLTVGATDDSDREATFSNYGQCVDLYAPGVAIRSTAMSGTNGRLESGTSMAAPHVSAAAALLWSTSPGLSGQAVQETILSNATRGTVRFPMGRSSSPNVLLHSPPAKAPAAPSRVRVSSGDARVTVRWGHAVSNTSTTSYTVTSKPGNHQCRAVNRSWCTVSGLTNGTAYTFTVRADNIAGTGPASSASPAVTPDAAPVAGQRRR